MVLTPHALVGAAITNSLPNYPSIGAIAAFASHFILDAIPHLDYDLSGLIDKENKTVNSIWRHTKALLDIVKISIDFVIGTILALVIFARDERTLFLTILGVVTGTLPDLLQFIHLKFKHPCTNSLQCVHESVQEGHKTKEYPLFGAIMQFAVPIIVIILFFLLT